MPGTWPLRLARFRDELQDWLWKPDERFAEERGAPAIIWSAPCPEGLRVHLACPAGVSADDLVEEREALAAACYAADVRVERDPRHATVVVLVVVTRIPLVPGPIPYTGT